MLQRLNWLAIAGSTPAKRSGIMMSFALHDKDYLRINADTEFATMIARTLTELGKPTETMEVLLDWSRYAQLMSVLSDILNLEDGDTFIKQFVMEHFDRMQQTRDKVVISGVTSNDQAFQLRKLGFFVVELVENKGVWKLANSVVDARLIYDPRAGLKTIVDALIDAQSKQSFVHGPTDAPPFILVEKAAC